MLEPEVSQWYKVQDLNVRFEILAVRDDFLIVQLQNGSIQEYSLEQWEEMAVVPISGSDSWSMSWSEDHDLDHDEEDDFDESDDSQYYDADSEFVQDFSDDDLTDLQEY